MARTDNFWDKVGGYIKSIFPAGVDILVNGLNKYINFNSVSGSTGYGFRDNNGVMEFKDASGAWVSFSSISGGSGTTEVFEFANVGAFPATGVAATIYIAQDTDKMYRWNGSVYVELAPIMLGTLVPYSGATSNVDLGLFTLKTPEVNNTGGNMSIVADTMQLDATLGSIILRSNGGHTGLSSNAGSTITYFDTTGQTADRTIVMPDNDGVMALVSDLDNLKPSGVSFAFYRSSGLVVGDGFKAVIPYAGEIVGWVLATKDGTNATITLSTKTADISSVPTFTDIDGAGVNRMNLTAQNKNSAGLGLTWSTTIVADTHIEITVAAVTGVVTGIYGIIEIAKT